MFYRSRRGLLCFEKSKNKKRESEVFEMAQTETKTKAEAKAKTDKVLIECGECKGTGIYVGGAEAKGEAVICFRCQGTGSLSATRFTERKTFPSGIHRVRWPSGTQTISYKDFLAGQMPPEN